MNPNLFEAITANDLGFEKRFEEEGDVSVSEILPGIPRDLVDLQNLESELSLYFEDRNRNVQLVKFLLHHFNIDTSNSHCSSVDSAFLSRFLRTSFLCKTTEYIQELIREWPSLIEATDENGCNLLHYACEFGEFDIAQQLLMLKPDLSKSYNNDGYTPLHMAALHNNHTVFKVFQRLAFGAFLVLTKIHQETVFHLVIRNNKFDAFLKLIEILGDSNELLRKHDQEGNRPLHISVSYNCLEIAEYLINKATEEELRTTNYAGLTALDIVQKATQSQDVSKHLEDLLLKRTKLFKPISYGELIKRDEEHGASTNSRASSLMAAIQPKSLEEWKTYYKVKKKLKKKKQDKKKHQHNMVEMQVEGLQNARNTINIIAILISTVAFTSCLNPPGGFFQSGPDIGKPVLGHTTVFKVFAISNDIALFLSLAIVVVLVSIIPFKKSAMQKLLAITHKALWLAVLFLGTAYIAARWATTLQVRQQKWMSGVVLSICGAFLGVTFVGLGILLIINILRKSKLKKRIVQRVDSNLPRIVQRVDSNLPRIVQRVDSSSTPIDSDIECQLSSGYYSY